MSGEDGTVARDEDRLPWLEAVEEEAEESGGSGRLIVMALIILALLAGVYAAYAFFLSDTGETEVSDRLIEAPDEPYRVPPEDAGGMEVEGEGDAAFAASEGGSPEGRIDADAMPEEPVAVRRVDPDRARTDGGETPPSSSTAAIPQAERSLAEATPRPVQVSPPAAGSAGQTVQLGAFSSEEVARRAWSELTGDFDELGALNRAITPVQSGGRTLYRLRVAVASGGEARSLCSRLRSAGRACSVVGN